MPFYDYMILDDNGEPTGEEFEAFQKMSDEAFTKDPDTGRPCVRKISAPTVAHDGPAWEWCEATKRYINHMKPKYIRDDAAGVRMKMPKGGV